MIITCLISFSFLFPGRLLPARKISQRPRFFFQTGTSTPLDRCHRLSPPSFRPLSINYPGIMEENYINGTGLRTLHSKSFLIRWKERIRLLEWHHISDKNLWKSIENLLKFMEMYLSLEWMTGKWKNNCWSNEGANSNIMFLHSNGKLGKTADNNGSDYHIILQITIIVIVYMIVRYIFHNNNYNQCKMK